MKHRHNIRPNQPIVNATDDASGALRARLRSQSAPQQTARLQTVAGVR